MKILIIFIAVIVIAAIGVLLLRRAGYRGAIGFKNRHSSEIVQIRLTGFSKPIDCGTLTKGEHSFNSLGRQDIPPEVRIVWRYAGEDADKSATVSLAAVPADASDGEIFFVLSDTGVWSVEYSPELQLDKLQNGGE